MKKTITPFRIIAAALLALGVSSTRPAFGADITKTNNTDNLNLGSSWVGGAAPTAADVGVWDGTVTGDNSVLLGADTNWLGLKITNPGGAVTIGAGNTLTLGAGGIDMSAATTNLTLNCNVALSASQPWNIASGRALAIGGKVSGAGGFTNAGAGTVTLGGANTYSGLTALNAGTVRLEPLPPPPTLGVTNALLAWFDASAITGLADGATVATWNDSSTNGNNATRTAGNSGYPIYKTGGLNGKPVVRFNPDRTSYFSFNRQTNIWTVFWVAKQNTAQGVGANFHFLLGDTTTFDFHRNDGGDQIWAAYASTNILNGTTRLNGSTVNGRTTTLGTSWNSIAVVTTNGPVTASRLSWDRTQANRAWDGDMAEVLIYGTALSPADVATVESYLTQKWLTPGSPLPSGTAVTMNSGAILDLNGVSSTIGSLSGTAGSQIQLGAAALMSSTTATNEFAGSLTGTSTFTRAGSGANGVLILSGTNTHGNTVLSGGNLWLGADNTLPVNRTVTVMNSGAFYVNGHNQTIADVIYGGGGANWRNGSATAGTLTINGSGNVQRDAGYIGDGAVATNLNFNLVFQGASPTNGYGMTLWGSNNKYTGLTTVRASALIGMGQSGQSWANPPAAYTPDSLTLDGGALGNQGAVSVTVGALQGITLTANGGYLFDKATGSGQNVTINSRIAGVGSLGILYQNTTTAVILGCPTNDYTGNTVIGVKDIYGWNSGGSGTLLTMGVNDALPYGSGKGNVTLAYSDSILNLNGKTVNVNGLSGNGQVDNFTGIGTLVAGNANVSSAFDGVIQNYSGTLALTKVGTGRLTLSGNNTYSGNTTISNGVLALTNAAGIASSAVITVNSNATFDVSGLATPPFTLGGSQKLAGKGTVAGAFSDTLGAIVYPGGINTKGTLTFSANVTMSGGTWTFDLGSVTNIGGGLNDFVSIGGGLNLADFTSTTIAINPLPQLTPGTYRLIQYAGAVTGAGSLNLASTNSGRWTLALDTNQVGWVKLVVSGSAANLVWSGDGALNEWDYVSQNWNTNTQYFYDFDMPTFDDRSINHTVNINTVITPGAMVVNTTNSYTFDGFSSLAGVGTLAKQGSGTLVVLNNNDGGYSGAVTVSGGTLQVGNGAASGALGAATIAVNSPATLELFRNDVLTVPNTVNGNGTVLFQGTGNSGESDYGIGAANAGFTGQVNINQARVRDEAGLGSLGGASQITVASGGQMYCTTAGTTYNFPLSIDGLGWGETAGNLGALRLSSGDIWSGNVTLTTNASVSAYQTSATISGTISGAYEIEFRSGTTPNGDTITLTPGGPNAQGSTRIHSGVTVVAGNANALGAGPVTLDGGALSVNGNSLSIGLLTSTNGGSVVQNGSTSTAATVMVGNATDVDFAGSFRDGGTMPLSLTKAGSGALSVTRGQLYGGATTVAAGTLRIQPVATNPVAGAAIWLDANDAATITADGNGNVSTWSNKGTAGGGFTQDGAALQPAYTNGGAAFNNRSVVRFSAAQALTNLAGYVNNGQEIHVFVAGYRDAQVNNSGLISLRSSSAAADWNNAASIIMGDRGPSLPNNPTFSVTRNGGDQPLVSLPGATGNGATFVVDFYDKADGTSASWLDGGSKRTASTSGSFAIDRVAIGGRFANADSTTLSAASFWNGKIAEVLVYDTALSDADRIAIEQYLRAKWEAFPALPPTTAVNLTVSSTVLDLTNAAPQQTIASLAGVAGSQVKLGGTTLASGDATSTSYDGVINGSGGLLKLGTGVFTLTGVNTYTGATLVSNGALLVSGSLASATLTVNPTGILGGTGTITGTVTLDGTLAPGASIGTLNLGALTMNPGSTTLMEISRPNTDVVNASSTTFGGTLTVTNTGSAFQSGDSFQLFTGGARTGDFAARDLPVLSSGLAWNWNPAAGTLSVTASMATNPTNITYSVNAGQLTLNWPTNHTGWKLQSQTNSRSVGLTGTWHDMGYTGTNQVTFPVDATQPTVFYRLALP